MANEDRIIRVILEGRDALSKMVRNATKSIDKDLNILEDDFDSLKKSADETDKSISKSFRNIGKSSQSIDKGVTSIKKYSSALKDLHSDIEKINRANLPNQRINRNVTETVSVIRRGLSEGLRISKEFQKGLDHELAATREIFKLRQQQIQEDRDDERLRRREEQNIAKFRLLERIRLNQLDDRVKLNAQGKSFIDPETGDQALILGRKSIEELEILKIHSEDKVEKLGFRNRISNAKRILRIEEQEELARLSLIYQKRRRLDDIQIARRKSALENVDEEAVTRKALHERGLLLDEGSGFERAVKKTGAAIGDFFTGIRRGRSDLRTLGKDIESLNRPFSRLGFFIGEAFKNINNLVNLRWTFLTGIFAVFINLVVNLGTALVALASSAGLAAAALGGAFAAGISQAIPVVGLLAAAFNRLGVVMDAVKLEEQQRISQTSDAKEAEDKRKQAVQRLEDAHWALKTALEGVGDAQFNLNRSQQDVTAAVEKQKKAVIDLADARKQAAQDIVDANLQEKESALSLQEAELAVLDAKQKLREEEDKKRKQNVDLDGARTALKEAQERLKLAQSQGDQAEITKANQQLSVARTNLNNIEDDAATAKNDIKDAQLAVRRAEINETQAQNKLKKDRQDAAEARRKGVSGADVVVNAQDALKQANKGIVDAQRDVVLSNRALRDSIHAVAIARREEADAKANSTDQTKLQTAAQQKLADALADFSPAEIKLFNSLKILQGAFKTLFSGTPKQDGILGPILNSFSTFIDALVEVLSDPRIRQALTKLSTAIGAGISKIAEFISSEAFKEDLLFFIDQATKNLPTVVDLLLKILKIFTDIAKAGAPIFRDFLTGTDKALGRLQQRTGARPARGGIPLAGTRGVGSDKQRTDLEEFMGTAEKHLKSWVAFGKALGRVILLITQAAAPSGQGLLESLTLSLEKFGDFIEKNPEKVTKFFEDANESVRQLASSFLELAKILGQIAQSQGFKDLTTFLLEVLIPALLTFFEVFGKTLGVILQITEIPVIGQLVKLGLTILIVEKSFNKILPVTQSLTNLINKGLKKAFFTLWYVMRDPRGAMKSAQVGLQLLALRLKIAAAAAVTAGKNFLRASLAIVTSIGRIALAMKAFLVSNPWILAIAAIITAIVLLDRKFHFLAPTIEFLRKQFVRIFNWIKDNWKLLVGILAAPFLLTAAPIIAIIKFRDQIIGFFTRIVNFVREHWKLIAGILAAPFLAGGLVLVTIFKFKDKIIGAFEAVGKAIVSIFETIKTTILETIKFLTDKLGEVWDKVPGPIKKIIEVTTDPVGAAKKFGKGAVKRIGGLIPGFAGGGDVTSGTNLARGRLPSSDTVPAMLTPGEWVLNKGQQKKIAAALRMTVEQSKAFLFGTNVGTSLPDGLKPSRTKSPFISGTFNLIPQEDDSGRTVWFIQMANGTFGQVTGRDATKIQATKGRYIPNYVRRNSNGFSQRVSTMMNPFGFAMGGVVPQSFNSGGIVQRAGFGNTGRQGAQVNQNMNIQVHNDADWGYVMRLSAITAQSAF